MLVQITNLHITFKNVVSDLTSVFSLCSYFIPQSQQKTPEQPTLYQEWENL